MFFFVDQLHTSCAMKPQFTYKTQYIAFQMRCTAGKCQNP